MVPETQQIADCRAMLQAELEERRRKNPAYSLTAFSRFLGISPASLSQILSGKRRLTQKTAQKIVSRCLFPPEQSRAFLASALGIEYPVSGGAQGGDWQPLNLELFRSICDWKHYALLSLGDIRPNSSDPAWLAMLLEISTQEAKEAFDRLLYLGLIERSECGFHQTTKPLYTPTVRTASMKKYHLENLRKASAVLELEDAPLELFSAVTMAVDESQLPAARQLIKDFRRKLCGLLETGKRERVYTLAIQLFPVTRRGS